MEGLILIAVVLPGVLTAALRRTVVFWLPGTGLIILGLVAFGSLSDTHGDVGGVTAMANGLVTLAGIGAIVYGLICLVVGATSYTRSSRSPDVHRPWPPVELPPASVVKDVSNR
jgi:hypothetical protein